MEVAAFPRRLPSLEPPPAWGGRRLRGRTDGVNGVRWATCVASGLAACACRGRCKFLLLAVWQIAW